MKNARLIILSCICSLACIISSCVNDLEKIKKITFDPKDPDEKTRELTLTYSDQRMETEVLYWNRTDSTIFTDQLVTIKTPKMLFFGQGLKAKQDFSSYKFVKPQGRFKIDK